MRKSLFFLMTISFAINVNAEWGLGPVGTPFCEETFDQEGDYLVDIDFDGLKEKICVNEYGNVKVYKVDCDGLYSRDVSTEIPYCYLSIHRCCPAHRAYTTINYSQKTIYIEAHYGSSDMGVRQFKKMGNRWKEIIPVKPMSIINEDLFFTSHLNKKIVGRRSFWHWGGF